MFYSIKGTLVHMEPGVTVIECGGVGFKCFTSIYTQKMMPQIGETALLYTTLNVREDALDLFGFATVSEQNCFKLLTNISGLGSKVGLAVLSELSPEQIALAASAGDYKAFARANGVGPKLAQRIVLELKDKAAKLSGTENMPQIQGAVISASSNASEAVNALTVLGYGQSEAASVVSKFDSSLSVEELIRLSLRAMAQK